MRARRAALKTKRSAVPAAEGFDRGDGKKAWGNKPMQRKQYHSRRKPFMAYDLETTRIAEGTPTVKYLTAYGADFKLSLPIKGRNRLEHLCEILDTQMLIERFDGYRFIAWYGNGFDVFFIAKALLLSDDFVIMPYMTRSKSVRGLKVIGINAKEGMEWEFLDGMSMTGLDTVKMKLAKFVSLMAPQYPKLALDFSNEEFDPRNKQHVAYAERDSEALYHGMVRASEIMRELTGNDLQPTMGNLAIKYFQSQMPVGVRVWKPSADLRDVLHGPAKRGGYCWIAKQYVGPIWKYDLNQAYAAAMRDAELPCGSCVRTNKFNPKLPGVYRVTISRDKRSPVPFYYRESETNAGRFTNGKEVETWIMSTEIDHLRDDDWNIKIHEGHYWQQTFNMRDMVEKLETLRFTDPEGPSGALGTMVKVLGVSAYGKTLEQLGGMEYVMAKFKPDGFSPYTREEGGDEALYENIFFRTGETFPRVYHQPQIGCFITAHVRIIVRGAALKAPRHFIYADTDCDAFSKPVDFLTINPTHYGDWKEESGGKEYVFIGKKIYHGEDGFDEFGNPKTLKHAKGLHVRELTKEDFDAWFKGKVPTQQQMQRRNFVKFMSGQPMFSQQKRSGTDVTKSKQAVLLNGEFLPR